MNKSNNGFIYKWKWIWASKPGKWIMKRQKFPWYQVFFRFIKNNEWTNIQETLFFPNGSQLNQLKLWLSSSFNLCFHQHGQNRRNKRHTQWITCGVAYFHRFHNNKWSTDRCICNGNRTEWSPIRSVIKLVINREYDDRKDWTTRSPRTS